MLGEFIRTIHAGEARAAFVPAVDDAARQVFDWAARQDPVQCIAASHFATLPDLRTLIDVLVSDLAEVALGIWPHWYGRDMSQVSGSRADAHDAALHLLHTTIPGNARGKVALPWLVQAAPKCQTRQRPLVHRVARSRQVHQLALAIEPHHLLLLLTTGDLSSSTDRILAFARAAEWLARHTQCPVLAAVPASLRDRAELDSISHGAFAFQADSAGAALCGVPSIVVDCANDLATFDERWPTTPEHWLRDDPSHADNFFGKTEMVVWTPGREDGNPLILQPIPDLAAVADNPQELSSAVAMVSDSLREIVAPGNALKAKNKHGILVTSLKYFAQSGGGGAC